MSRKCHFPNYLFIFPWDCVLSTWAYCVLYMGGLCALYMRVPCALYMWGLCALHWRTVCYLHGRTVCSLHVRNVCSLHGRTVCSIWEECVLSRWEDCVLSTWEECVLSTWEDCVLYMGGLCSFYMGGLCALYMEGLCALFGRTMCSLRWRTVCSLLWRTVCSLLWRTVCSLHGRTGYSLHRRTVCSLHETPSHTLASLVNKSYQPCIIWRSVSWICSVGELEGLRTSPLSCTRAPATCVGSWRRLESTGGKPAEQANTEPWSTRWRWRRGLRDNAFEKHLALFYPEDKGDITKFTIKVVSSFKKPLPRKKTEAVKIHSTTADHFLKSKAEIGCKGPE